MSYAQLGRDALDYQPCQYPGSPMTFRGPKCDLEEPYILCLGGSETFGKFSTDPFPDRLGDRLGRRVVNMGAMNACVDLFLHDAAVKAAMGRAQAVVLQVPGAANMSNRFFTVHPRRNDRFLKASTMMRTIFREVDFTEFHFTRHMLSALKARSADRFAVVVEELRAAWVARMAQLIDVTMDFARASLGGGIPVDRNPVSDLKDRFERVIDEIRLAHPGRDITLDYRHEGAVTCDPDRLDQLLSNLVANAVTHGSRNRPIVVGAGAVDGDFELTVANEGKPIPEEIRAHLFEPFNRATRSESLQGLGLGLYIAAEIARAHDGEISAASDAARTVFRLRIPVTPEG